MTRLISVVIPCYNAEHSVLKSIRSLQKQSYPHWEAIVVNDGSTDGTRDVILGIDEARIQYYEFKENRGRGAARQKGLEMATGEFLAMVDADDWIYDNKLEDQVRILEDNPNLSLISGGMAITDGKDQIIGMRIGDNVIRTWTDIGFPPIPHGPSMIRMSVAKPFSYDVTMKHSQDIEFLSKCMLGKEYMVSSKIWYVYSEHVSVTKYKILVSYLYSLKYISRYVWKRPMSAIKHIILLLLKICYLGVVSIFKSTEQILKRRSTEPTTEIVSEFEKQRSNLDNYLL